MDDPSFAPDSLIRPRLRREEDLRNEDAPALSPEHPGQAVPSSKFGGVLRAEKGSIQNAKLMIPRLVLAIVHSTIPDSDRSFERLGDESC